MPQNRSYEEHDVETGAWSEFFCYFFVVTIGFPMQIGWVLTSWFGMSGLHLLVLSGALGLLAGIYGAWECHRSEKRRASRLRLSAELKSQKSAAKEGSNRWDLTHDALLIVCGSQALVAFA